MLVSCCCYTTSYRTLARRKGWFGLRVSEVGNHSLGSLDSESIVRELHDDRSTWPRLLTSQWTGSRE